MLRLVIPSITNSSPEWSVRFVQFCRRAKPHCNVKVYLTDGWVNGCARDKRYSWYCWSGHPPEKCGFENESVSDYRYNFQHYSTFIKYVYSTWNKAANLRVLHSGMLQFMGNETFFSHHFSYSRLMLRSGDDWQESTNECNTVSWKSNFRSSAVQVIWQEIRIIST